MSRIFKAGLGVALALALCSGAQAQSRGRLSMPIRVSSTTTTRMVRVPQFQTTFSPAGDGIVVLSGPTFVPLNAFAIGTFGTFPAPGLGFDFAHLAAINRNFKVSDISVLTSLQRLALVQSLAPIAPFAVPFFSTPAPVIVMQQPPVVLVQQPAVQEAAYETPGRARYAEPKENVEPARPPEPPREVGEFVLVRRDGRLVFAVAFTTQGDLLTYISREGIRRSMPLAELDIEATRRMNEERGTTLQLPI